MRTWLAALALFSAQARAQGWMRPVGTKPYGVLVLGYGIGAQWREPIDALRKQLKNIPVEAVDAEFQGAIDGLAIQHALDKLVERGVAKIVAVPLETMSSSPLIEETRYLFGLRANSIANIPMPQAAPLEPRGARKSSLVLPSAGRPRRLKSPVPLILADTIDRSPVLVEILAARAKALSRKPALDAIVLAGVAPLSDGAMKEWLGGARAIAEKVRAAAGFRQSAAVALRDGERPEQREQDTALLSKTVRILGAQGGVVVLPLAADGTLTGQLLRRRLSGAFYRWDGRGLFGDRRLLDWIQSTAAAASSLPEDRRYREDAPLKRGLP